MAELSFRRFIRSKRRIEKAIDFVLQRLLLPVDYFKFLVQQPQQFGKRLEILRKFRHIHKAVPCAHLEAEALYIADSILRIPLSLRGDIIECGTYKGGGTCKLSIVAKLTGRRLFACDSFVGLPEPKPFDKIHVHCDGTRETYQRGDYSASVDEVCANLEKYGEPDVVTLVPGWFQETLPLLKQKRFVLVFIDVDLYESIICCIENLWPVLQKGCRFFTHEAQSMLTVKAFQDMEFWKVRMGMNTPPIFVGAKRGLGITKKFLGYIRKPITPL